MSGWTDLKRRRLREATGLAAHRVALDVAIDRKPDMRNLMAFGALLALSLCAGAEQSSAGPAPIPLERQLETTAPKPLKPASGVGPQAKAAEPAPQPPKPEPEKQVKPPMLPVVRAEEVDCPYCGQPAGEPCRTRSGRLVARGGAHQGRWQAFGLYDRRRA